MKPYISLYQGLLTLIGALRDRLLRNLQRVNHISISGNICNHTLIHTLMQYAFYYIVQVKFIYLQVKATFEKGMVWGESQMDRGKNPKYAPCAKPGCSPFPTCCTTDSDSFIQPDMSMAVV